MLATGGTMGDKLRNFQNRGGNYKGHRGWDPNCFQAREAMFWPVAPTLASDVLKSGVRED